MSEILETVTLWGKGSTMPGIPTANVRGDLSIDGSALVFRAHRGNIALTISLEQIKECFIYWDHGTDAGSFLVEMCTAFLLTAKEWFVRLTYYSAVHDMDTVVDFFVGNSANTPVLFEKKATALAKAIWERRSMAIGAMRQHTSIRYR